MPFFATMNNNGKSIRWHPSLEVGPTGSSYAESAVAEHGLLTTPLRRGRGARFALASLALLALAGLAAVMTSGSSLSKLGPGLGLSFGKRPKFDPEAYAARGFDTYEERMSAMGSTDKTSRSLRLLLPSDAADDGTKEAEKEKRESAEGYRKLQLSTGGFGTGEGIPAESDERSVVQTITGYDTSTAYSIPEFYNNFEYVWESMVQQDQPLLWYVPKAGGNTLNKLFAHCLGMILSSSIAATVPGALDGSGLVINTFQDGSRYINADPSTLEGLQKLADGGIVSANPGADVIITQRLEASKVLFSPPLTGKGRLFVMLRHPIKRVVDQFYYRQRATWESEYDKSLAAMSLEEFAASDRLVENFVVRSLVHKLTTDVTASDVEMAKNILRMKFVVGIFEWFDLSVVRFEKYFGWWDEHQVLTDTAVNHCHYDRISTGGHVGAHPKASPGSEAYKKIAVRNWADLELYFYAKNLFYSQSALI